MIGKSLTKSQMITVRPSGIGGDKLLTLKLLRNMGTIDQPWVRPVIVVGLLANSLKNCPHGRPTMRHLSTLARPSRPRSGSDRIDWARVEL